MITNVTEKIKARRKELGLTDIEMARRVGMSIFEYGDIEQHANEIFTVTPLNKVKKLCELLDFTFSDLFEMRCVFCAGGTQYSNEYSLPRNDLIRKRRDLMGLSKEDLGERVGFYEVEIENLENDPDHLETWTIDTIQDFADAINVPLQVLLHVKCEKCGR